MEAWSFAPIRVAAVIRAVSDGAQAGMAAELRMVGRLALICREGGVEQSPVQSAPDGDELAWLDGAESDVDFTQPPAHNASRRIAGQLLAGALPPREPGAPAKSPEMLFGFRGAPAALTKLSLPLFRPAVFVGTTESAREGKWSLGGATLDPVERVVTISWKAKIPVSARDTRGVALVGLGASPMAFEAFSRQARGFDPRLIEQRLTIPIRGGAFAPESSRGAESARPAPPRVSTAVDPIDETVVRDDDTASMGGHELDAALMTAALPAIIDVRGAPFQPVGIAQHAPLLAPAAPARVSSSPSPPSPSSNVRPPSVMPPLAAREIVNVPAPKRSIGEVLSLDPRAHAAPSAPVEAHKELEKSAPVDVVLERIWIADEAIRRVRAHEVIGKKARAAKRSDAEGHDERLVALAMKDASTTPVHGLLEALDAMIEKRLLTAEIAVVEGDVEPSLEPVAAMRALVAAARALGPKQDRFARVVDEAAGRAARPAHASSVLANAARDLAWLREALTAASSADAATALEDVAFARLLRERALERVEVFGERHALLRLAPRGQTAGAARQAESAVPVYLPEAALASMPLVLRLESRLLVEVHPRVDERETAPIALRALAICREHTEL